MIIQLRQSLHEMTTQINEMRIESNQIRRRKTECELWCDVTELVGTTVAFTQDTSVK